MYRDHPGAGVNAWERPPGDGRTLSDVFREMSQSAGNRPEDYSLVDIDWKGRRVVAGPRIFISVNWAPFAKESRQRIAVNDYSQTQESEISSWSDPMMPSGMPALLTARVPVNELNIRDLEWLASLFRGVLKRAIENAPTADEAPQMATSVPREQFDLLMSETFDEDLDRFGRWAEYGMTMEEIAEEDDGISVRAVRDSIHKICSALGASSTVDRRAIRQRLMGPVECPKHGRDCEGAAITVIESVGLVKDWRSHGRVQTRRCRERALRFSCQEFERSYQRVDRLFKMPEPQDLPLDERKVTDPQTVLSPGEPFDEQTGLTRDELIVLRHAILGESPRVIAEKLRWSQGRVQSIHERAERKLLVSVQARMRSILIDEINKAISRLLNQSRLP